MSCLNKRALFLVGLVFVQIFHQVTSFLLLPPTLSKGTSGCLRSSQIFGTTKHELDIDTSGFNLLNETTRTKLSSLIEKRSDARARGDFATADDLKSEIQASVPSDLELQLCDVPRKEGGGSTWTVVETIQHEPMEGTTVLQLAHAALGHAISSSPQDSSMSEDLNRLVEQAKKRLQYTDRVILELSGRKAADAAFWFALAGATDPDLFDSLTEICGKELARFGTRSSCRTKDVWHVLERLAAAGIRHDEAVEQAALLAFESKKTANDESLPTTSELLDFHSDRCLLMIWKFSTRQRKQRAFLQSALKHWQQQYDKANGGDDDPTPLLDTNAVHKQDIDWFSLYKDPHRPLVIDIGCGMGVSLLGLAQGNDDASLSSPPIDFCDCNFAGVDLSGLAIGYAHGLSKRWNLNDRLHFFVNDAESFMKQVHDSYPGHVRCCLVQFPTPYRLQLPDNSSTEARGNSQLPIDMTSGFMVTEGLLRLIHDALRRCNGGVLLLQSNCEDVAVYMRETACAQIGFEYIESITMANEGAETHARVPKRTLDWIAMGGSRAEGNGWISTPVLPRVGRTETEVACMANGTPLHRCLLQTT